MTDELRPGALLLQGRELLARSQWTRVRLAMAALVSVGQSIFCRVLLG